MLLKHLHCDILSQIIQINLTAILILHWRVIVVLTIHDLPIHHLAIHHLAIQHLAIHHLSLELRMLCVLNLNIASFMSYATCMGVM